MSDAMLCDRVRAGDARALAELLDRHADIMRVVAREYFAPGETYDDLLQAARVGVWKAALDFEAGHGSGFRNFASLCVRRNVITLVKTATRGKHAAVNKGVSLHAPRGDSDQVLADVLPGPASDEPHEIVVRRQKLRRQVRALRSASYLEREVVARRLNGRSLADAGDDLGSGNAKTADNALQRVRKLLEAA